MFTTLLVDEHGRRDTGHSNRKISVEEEKKTSTCSKIFSWIKLFFAHLFGHIGLTALVVGYSIFGAFLFSYLEGANEILIRVKVGNKRGETLEELWNVTASLRDLVIQQELELGRLREELDAETLARSRCQDNRRREGSFLEAIIDECKRDNVPLSDSSCSEFCRKNQVKLPVCKALCQSKVPPCSYWHKDTHKAPIVSFEEVTNRTRREESKMDIWLERLQEYREMGNERNRREYKETGILEGTNDVIEEAGDVVNPAKHDEGTVMEADNYGSQFIQVVQLSNETECHQLSCVTHDDSDVVACLDFTHLNKSAGFFRLKKHFNVLWKANWTRDAEKILKAFEKDVIMKVKTDGYDGKEAVEGDVVQEPSQWSLSGALLYSVTIITTIGYGNIAPKTSIGQIVTMVYACFGMPVFMLWASNMGTLMAQTFTFLYAHFCCFICRRADRRKAERLMKKRAERDREREKTGSTRLLWSERDGSPGMTMSSRLDSMSPWSGEKGGTLGRNGSSQRQGITDPEVKNLLTTCAKYNIHEGYDDDPMSEAVVEEIRHADTMDIIHERLMSAPQSPKKHAHKNEKMFPREMREGSAYENFGETVDTGQDRSRDAKTKEAYILSLERKGQSPISRPSENGLLSPPPIIAPRASRDPSPASTTRGPQADGIKEEKLIAQYMEGPPPIERVPPLPVLCFLGFYLSLGALIFSEWESWSFTEGFYFSFITLTTIGFGDYVPGDAVMSVDSKDGQYKLVCSVVYLLLGLAVLSMSFNLIQEEAVEFFIKQAKNCGIIDDDDDDEDSER